jgi:hypothetical protein
VYCVTLPGDFVAHVAVSEAPVAAPVLVIGLPAAIADMTCRCAVVGACRVDRAVECVKGWTTACRDNQDAGGVASPAVAPPAGLADVACSIVVVAPAAVAVSLVLRVLASLALRPHSTGGYLSTP